MSAVNRLRAHADAAKAASEARAREDALSIGEHPDVLEDAYYERRDAEIAEMRALIAYANPQGVAGNLGMR